MPTEEQMRAAMQKYLDALNKHDVAGAVGLFAQDGTVEDPVGTGVAVAAERLPKMIGQVPEGTTFTLDTPIRTSHGSAAAMAFTLRGSIDGEPVEVRSVDVMEFNEHGLITHMNAYNGPSDVIRGK